MQPRIKFYIGLSLSVISFIGSIPMVAVAIICGINRELTSFIVCILLLGILGFLYWVGRKLIQASGYMK